MPLPANAANIEIHVHGVCAAGGSSARFADFSYFYARQNPALPLPTKSQIDTAFQSNIVVPLAACLNARYLQSRNSIRYLDDALDAFVDFSHAAVGAIAGDSMATFLAAFQLLRTGVRGKSYQGKKHIFPISESDTTSGTDDILNAAALTRFGTLQTAMLAGFTDGSGNVWKPVVVSRRLSQLRVNPVTIVSTLVTSIVLNKRLGSMVRRKVASDY